MGIKQKNIELICAASKRGNMQKQRANTAYRETENKSAKISEDTPDKRDKIEERRASKRAYMQKQRANAAYRETENKKAKISAGGNIINVPEKTVEHTPDNRDKVEKHRASKRAYMQKQRATKAYRERERRSKHNAKNLLSECLEKTNGSISNRHGETLPEANNDASSHTCMVSMFHENIRYGPEYICTCCDQLWYKSSIKKCNASNYSKCQQTIIKSCITGVKSVDDTEWICNTCHSNLKDNKLPQCSKANGMHFPEKPKVLDLTPLEERLISPCIPFMQIRELPRGGQLTIHGNDIIVNVPSDVNSTVHTLPRPISGTQTIPIKLKRRLSYKHHYQFQNVRPRKVLKAAKYLVRTSKLFQNEGLEIQDSWQNSTTHTLQSDKNQEWDKFFYNSLNAPEETNGRTETGGYNSPNEAITCDKTSPENSENDVWCEVEERPFGVTDTLLQEPHITENGDNIMSFAPGEGNKPLGIFMDTDSEFLSFPTIFCGKQRVDNKQRHVPVSYSTVAKWEIRCQDRRAAQSVPNLFYKLKKLQVKQIQDTACISLHKCKTKGKKYTAGELKTEDYTNKLIHLDEGFRVLKKLM